MDDPCNSNADFIANVTGSIFRSGIWQGMELLLDKP